MLNHHFESPIEQQKLPKRIYLSQTTIKEIEDFAKQRNDTFSAAIEFLASRGLTKKGLDDIVLGSYLRDVVRKESAAHYNRFAKLIAHAGLEAGAAKEAAQQLYFLKLVELSKSGKFEQAVGVNPESPEGKKIIGFYSKKKQDFRWRSVQFLKKKLLELTEILEEVSG
jgi:hypothetical protein